VLLLAAGLILVAVVWVAAAAGQKRALASGKIAAPPTVSELRRRAGIPVRREPVGGLLERCTFVFVSTSALERRLDHRLEDAEGNAIGSTVQIPRPHGWTSDNGRPSRFSPVRVEIRDIDGTPVAQLVRPSGLLVMPVTVLNASRIPIGSLTSGGRRRTVMTDVLNRPHGAIQRTSRGLRVDYTIENASGSPIGTISDLGHLAARLQGDPDLRPVGRGQPTRHVLEITASVDPDLRLLMLGAAAAVYLVLQRPYSENTD